MQSDSLLKLVIGKMSNDETGHGPSYIDRQTADLPGVVSGAFWCSTDDQVGVADSGDLVDIVSIDAIVKNSEEVSIKNSAGC